MSAELAISPSGHLFIEEPADARLDVPSNALLKESFSRSRAHGLELLGGDLLHGAATASVAFWREFARKFFTAVCHAPQFGTDPAAAVVCGESDLAGLVDAAPPMKGLEYLNAALLAEIWNDLDRHARQRIAESGGSAAEYLHGLNPVWNAVGRVTFHLAENKRNAECPFAFLATYSHGVSEQGKVRHLPLGRALQDYAGAQNRAALASLLAPVQAAAKQSKLARELLDTRAIFHPQTWRPDQAYRFLQEIPLLEQSGLSIRIPDWWKSGRPPRPKVNIRIGEKSGGVLGRDSLLDFKVELSLDGESLTDEEWKSILNSTDGLALIKGKWVEVDREKLQEVLNHWTKVQAQTGPDGLSLLEGLRLLSGYDPGTSAAADAPAEIKAEWSSVTAGEWLGEALEQIRDPQATGESDPGTDLRAELRPYQRLGVHWLWFMSRLGLGMCLADDMGLGKTIQVISLLLVGKREARRTKTNPAAGAPSLLVVPASLLGNWKGELERFAPSLSVVFAHPSEASAEALQRLQQKPAETLQAADLVITSYGLLSRSPWLKELDWNLVILDEAQAIKNPAARQTRAVKELRSRCRVALSGTPIENRLSDLWSLFDFICPGLLGGAKEFSSFVKNRAGQPAQFAPLRRLVRPYILRRLKTDKRVISDLPDKTELLAYCPLSRSQAALYQKSVVDLEEILENSEIEGIKRRGVILAFLTRFKQICNHPSQWLADGIYQPVDSGKFQRLRELAEEIAARQEKVLVFSQYREMTDPLARFLGEVFGRPGLVLHGGTAVRKRKELVDEFQREDGPPFFVLSLKAGGTGLNLTAASHVIHFDRWWNPAVENQATDRAFRIGQKRNVMVQKFVCRGTLEERINELMASKKELAEDILGEGAEKLLTEMSNSQLLNFVRLDMNAVAGE
jgi:superfamily II DNA or RNA helicase